MRRLLCLVALLSLGLGSCTTPRHAGRAPRRWVRYYHHQQRRQERERRRLHQTNITWSKL